MLGVAITGLLKRKGIITPIDFSRLDDEKYMEDKNREINTVTSDYIPYSSNYNSMVLFSLNGIVPDDKEAGFGNNTFSNKKCAIIDSLSSHIDDVISLNPTDTAIKGNVKLSSDAVVLIEKNTYNTLSEEDKIKLNSLSIFLFEGNLRDAVEAYLKSSQRYTCERLALSSSKGGYLESPTSERLKETIKKIAEEKELSTAYHLNIILHNTESNDKLSSVADEHQNILTIKDYYKKEFYKFLFNEMPVREELQYYLLNFDSEIYVEELCEAILDYGLENYKKICDKFNNTLEFLSRNNILPSPQKIIDSIKLGVPIDLCDMIMTVQNYYANENGHDISESETNKSGKKH